MYWDLVKDYKTKFVQDSIWLFISQSILIFSGIFQFLIISRYYKVSGLGYFSQAFAFFSIFSAIANWGLAGLTLMFSAELVEENHNKNKMIYSVILLSICLSLFFTILIIVGYFLIPGAFSNQNVAKSTVVFCFAIPFYNINRILLAFFQGGRKMKFVSSVRSIKAVILLILLFVFSVSSQSLFVTVLAYMITEFLLLTYLSVILLREIDFCFSKQWINKLFSLGFKNFLVDVIAYAQDRIDILVFGYMLSNYEAGIFSFVSTAARSLLLVSSTLMQNFDPIIANLWSKSKIDEIRHYFRKLKQISVLIMTPLLLLSIIIYTVLVKYFLTDFSSTPLFFALLAAGVYLFSLINWTGGMFVMCGKLNENIFRTGLILLSGVVLNIIGVLTLGLWGAVIAGSLQMIAIIFIQTYFIRKYFNINILSI